MYREPGHNSFYSIPIMQALNKNIKSLHIIRGVAALIVVIYHSKFILWAGGTLWLKNIGFKSLFDYIPFALDMLSSCGAQCVLVFFLLSGFVIYHSFQQSDRSIKHFFWVRILRIYLPFLFSLFILGNLMVVIRMLASKPESIYFSRFFI